MIVNGEFLTMTRGDSETITVKMKTSDGGIYPFVEGDIVELTVRKKPLGDIVLHKTVTEFEEDGSAIIAIDPVDTSSAEFGKYMYDIQWTNAGGGVKTIVKPTKNNFVIAEEVTY